MAFSLRLSPYLEAEARSRAELLGISLNSLISVALDLHLHSSRAAVHEVPPPLPVAPAIVENPVLNKIATLQKCFTDKAESKEKTASKPQLKKLDFYLRNQKKR